MSQIYLGVDYGTVHIGLAYADGPLATPLPPFKNGPQLLSHLTTLVHEHHITHLIVGLPTGPLEAEVRALAAELKRSLSLPVTLHDETLSTHEASEKLRQPGVSRHKRRHEHSYAAALILEDYLESVLN